MKIENRLENFNAKYDQYLKGAEQHLVFDLLDKRN